MRLVFKFCVAAALLALAVSPAVAQRQRPGGGGFGGFGGGGLDQLLTNKSVQEEVKIDKDQAAKIDETVKKFREDNKDDYDKSSFRNQDTKPEEKAEIRKKLNEKFTDVAKDLVKPEQMKRIKQIQLQQQGLMAFTSEDVQKQLKITDDQKDQLKTIGEDLRKDMGELRQNAGGNFQEMATKMRELNKDAMEKVQKILTDDQKKSWKEMTGEPFQVRFEQPRRPGGNANPPRGESQAQPKKIDF